MLNPYAQNEADRYRKDDRRRQAEYDRLAGTSPPESRKTVFVAGSLVFAAATVFVAWLLILN